MHRWLKTANPSLKYPAPKPGLPDPNAASSDSEAALCAAANDSIVTCIETMSPTRGPYNAYSADQRLEIAKHALQNGLSNMAKPGMHPTNPVLNFSYPKVVKLSAFLMQSPKSGKLLLSL